jgi:vancomycin resistance protein YoaR
VTTRTLFSSGALDRPVSITNPLTTRTTPLPLLVLPSGGFAWRRLFYSFLLTFAALAIFVSAFVLGYARMHEDRVLPGVEVAGISLAGLDRAEAETRLREALPSLSSGQLTVRFANEAAVIPYSAIGRDYNMGLMVEQAFSVGRDGALLEQAQEQLRILLRGVTVERSLTWNSQELARRVAQVAAGAHIEPIDARIVRDNGRYAVLPAVPGQSVDAERGIELSYIAVNNLSPADTSVTVDGVAIPPAVSTESAAAAVERVERVTADALSVSGGGGSAVIEPERILGWVQLTEPATGSWEVVIAREPIAQFVAHYAREVDLPAQDASFAFRGEDVVAVPGRDGQAVDAETSTNSILAALRARADGGGPPHVAMSIVAVEPDFSYEQAQALAPRAEMLADWRTNFVPGPMNFEGANISIPTDKIDGTVLNPGETFDFWDVVGEPTREEGYGDGGAIIRGRTVPDGALAGGICSCSTTIFNAALRAGLEMGARRNHFYYINRYPVGLDATVWISNSGRRQTMRFTNDMEHPVLVRGINRRGAVIFEVWGVPDGRTVSFSEPVISNQERAYEILRYSDNLKAGTRRRIEWPANGFDSTVTRTVRDANGNVIHKDTFKSRYAMIKGITLVGRSANSPEHGTEVRSGGRGSD